ncbi:MAG: TatD family hydrolase [Nanoarchaeota archaeon]|nr:TatD family hydrolase [Nanoarchaeota archaeon]
MLVDVHAHMEHKAFEPDLTEVLERAKQAGLTAVISSGTNYELNVKTLDLAKKFPIIKPALGLYPADALRLSEEEFEKSLDFIKAHRKEIIAIGEIGLDFQEAKGKEEEQEKNFSRLLQLSEELKLPVIVHSRKAEEKVIEVLEGFKAKKVVMHCFSGSMSLVKRAEDNGWMFSVPCNVVFSEHFQNLVRQVSVSQLLTETDAPFLPPVKGQRNEPMNVAFTVKKIAEIKGLDPEEVEKIVFMNFKKIFR